MLGPTLAIRIVNQAKNEQARFLSELSSGLKYGVFIDDTGSPGLETKKLHPERKSWVAVVVPPKQMPEVLEQLPLAIEELKKYGVSEFHFADIYSGSGEIRLGVVGFMAKIFEEYRFPIIVQTFDPVTLKELRTRSGLPSKIEVFDLRRQNDLGLLFLIMRVKLYIERHRQKSSVRANVFVDEGYKKDGTAISIPNWASVFADGLVCFARSSTIYPIQLSDFAAWSLNRTQLILDKDKPTDLDLQLLIMLSKISWNYINIDKRSIRF